MFDLLEPTRLTIFYAYSIKQLECLNDVKSDCLISIFIKMLLIAIALTFFSGSRDTYLGLGGGREATGFRERVNGNFPLFEIVK